jgi:glyoxylase-like metal-dependent hydrolase (beta-lactamase superfamily II)
VRITPVTPNLTQVMRLRLVNAYLVREADGFTLVDTMTGSAADGLAAAAEKVGGPIRRIALTHCHGDHVGALDALKARLGDSVEVLMPELEARILAGETVVEGRVGFPRVTTRPDVRLAAGDRVGSLEVVPTPGHSPGHIAFLDTRDRTMIAGDVYTTVGRAEVTSHTVRRFPFTGMATWDRALALESARTVRALDPPVLVVGHGRVVRHPAAEMDEAIARAEAVAAKAEAA